jgi:outer membrane protein insertion porin family
MLATTASGSPISSAAPPPQSDLGKREQTGDGTVCGLDVPAPAQPLPEAPQPIVLASVLCFDSQGGASTIDPQTYLYYIQFRASEPSRGRWVTWDDAAERVVRDDFRRLWATNFLDDLSIELRDHRFANGVTGKLLLFHMEERQRIKIVDYEGLVHVDQSAIDERLKEKSLSIRLDSFIDADLLRRVAASVRELYAEKGYHASEVTANVRQADTGPKLVHVTFHVVEGPKVAIRDVEFLGNRGLSDDRLAKALKENRPQGLWSLIGGGGTFKEDKFAEDAQNVIDLYRDHGYILARVGQPQLRPLDDSADGATRWVQLRIPVTEGARYRIGEVTFEGNSIVGTEVLRALVPLEPGAIYSQKVVAKGLEKARELYGAGGYFEFTAFPDLQPRPEDRPRPGTPPIVDVVLRIDEGRQYFVNRISFVGNTHTLDPVIRRELALVEAGVFNTEALKYSVRRLNQLGYFKPLEGEAVSVEKTPGADNKVDVRLALEEQNRHQISFGAGASQYEGFFGNLSFSTSNFIGRGETLSVSLQKGARTSSYQLGFTEPFLFGKPITAGVSLFSRKFDYRLYADEVDYSEVRTGTSVTGGVPFRRFTKLFLTYGYEVIETASSDALAAALDAGTGVRGNFLFEDGRFVQSSLTPSLVYNTVDNPLTPRDGLRLTASYQYSGGFLGGTMSFVKPDLEAVIYRPVTRRTALGLRANVGWVTNYGRTELPYYLRYFLGGEMQIRGVDIRTVGPVNDEGAVTGGTKFVLFNAEYYVDLFPNVRALLFHDAGQAFDERTRVSLRDLRTSTGAELRVTLPMIGVPFRLIYAWNIYRDTFQPARTFKFAVGTTF